MADKRVFGHIPGVAPGSNYATYAALNSAGVHKPTQAGISGSGKEGADSIVVSGGYEDDLDLGDAIVYTGHGGRDKAGVHIKDQTLDRGNLALVMNEMEGLPVRVIRGADPRSSFAPTSGYRYDGLYRVESHWHETGKAGFKVWRYRLLKIDDGSTIPAKPGSPAVTLDGGNSNPTRKITTVQRVVRDTKQAKKLKLHYDHSCQVCGTRITTAAGAYAEAAHIRPLGAPHNGPDTADNIICLCPNHHGMVDLGAFAVADDFTLIGIPGTLTVQSGHQIDKAHLRYHREHYLNRGG
jgi:putative restriction endonuclease